MSRISFIFAAVLALSSICLASSVEVLYLTEPLTNGTASLRTYNVDARTAVAQQIGPAINIPATSVDPLTVLSNHLIYVWNSTDVWVYSTNLSGVPQALVQHLRFGLPQPVLTFLADPDGKFAYAGMSWFDGSAYRAAVVLFTIDQSSGKLTNTKQVVGTYGPSYYLPITNFLFGASGHRLYYFVDFSYAPHSCGGEYDYYPVNQTTGLLGKPQSLVGWADCGSYEAGTFTDRVTAVADAPNGQGSGTLVINGTFTGGKITCTAQMLSFCGDDPARLNLDPAGSNIFFTDQDTNEISIGHIDFSTSTLLGTSSSIPGAPILFFSPDSKLVYAVDLNDVYVYAFNPTYGTFTASSSFTRQSGNFYVATTTLHVQ